MGAQPRTIGESLALRRFLLTGWPWRGLWYVLSTPVVSVPAGALVAVLGLPWVYLVLRLRGADPVAPGEVVLVSLAGLLLIALGGPLVAVPVARLELLRLRLVHPAPAPPLPTGAGGRLRRHYTAPGVWRQPAYLVVVALAALPSAVVALTLTMVVSLIVSPLVVAPGRSLALGLGQADTVAEALPYALLGVALLPVTAYLVAGLAGLHAAAARALLSRGPDERLRTELVEVARSRERLVTAFEAERRRIERDLHDGAQQRVVSLILHLGLAKLEIPPGAPGAELVAGAHDQARQLLTELREFIHGVHPQALTDLGLPAALRELADRSPVTVTVDCALPRRPSGAVEGAAYFVVAEALGNATKYSGAREIRVTAAIRRDVLTVEVTDDGRGGADADRGTGLTGLADRAAALGGTLSLSSPPGGPTTVRAELPCRPEIP
ncbi:sensor domain-containing protein [Actinosynnema sp. NPDC020468]|uniref:sensor histidine kinase n=1 Tax=Actinosynnema sp. NPDC020468 TaxID=3154488 RepID=UPI0033EB46AC